MTKSLRPESQKVSQWDFRIELTAFEVRLNFATNVKRQII